MKTKIKIPKLMPACSASILQALTVISLILSMHSCSLFEDKIVDCYDIGRELTEEEKNIFPYEVGDTVLFTDGERDYYISCERIIDTIYTVNENGDIYCEGEVDRDDEHIRYIAFNTDIPLYDSCKSFGITISPDIVSVLFYEFNHSFYNDYEHQFTLNTDRILLTKKSNNYNNDRFTLDDKYQLYLVSLMINSVNYLDVYKLSSWRTKHSVDTCYVKKGIGILQLTLNEDQIITIK